MSRTIRDASLDSRTARARLKARGKPYYRAIEPGLHLGYRRPTSGAGKWLARHYTGNQTYQLETIATADDYSDADGVAVLNFKQAQEKARGRMVARAHTAACKGAPVTVADAMESYIEFLANNRKSASDARYRDTAFIRPKFGDVEVAALTADMLRRWQSDLAKQPPRLRTKKGHEQQFGKLGLDDEAKRRRRASANRTLTVLKAALNLAFRDGRVPSDIAWRGVKRFGGTDTARLRHLSLTEAKRLINAADTDFRRLVQGALQTGARYGELTRLRVHDFNQRAGTVEVRQSKSGKSRHIVLSDEGVALFCQLCAGRAGDELIFLKANGKPWGRAHQGKPMAVANAVAKIKPPTNFHSLRHTWASLALMNGVPLMVVARNLGHNDTRMVEKHYGHLTPSFITDAIRANAPKFSFKPDRKIAAFRP
jgi:integrase